MGSGSEACSELFHFKHTKMCEKRIDVVVPIEFCKFKRLFPGNQAGIAVQFGAIISLAGDVF